MRIKTKRKYVTRAQRFANATAWLSRMNMPVKIRTKLKVKVEPTRKRQLKNKKKLRWKRTIMVRRIVDRPPPYPDQIVAARKAWLPKYAKTGGDKPVHFGRNSRFSKPDYAK